jgi:hypothetical protein
MSKLSQLRKHGHEPEWWLDTGIPWFKNRTPDPILDAYGALYWWLSGTEFHSIPDADWDTLLLLDACRYDVFTEVNDLPGRTEKRYSPAPRTPEFLQANFATGTFHDTVYVTANPHVRKQLDDAQFHDVYHLWETHWDSDLKSVHPSAVADVARETHETYPNKRIVVHFMQPHLPFIGEWAREHVGIYNGYDHTRSSLVDEGGSDWKTDPYALQARGEFDIETIRKAYRENLKEALVHVESLTTNLSGSVVVSSDHGELLGDVAWPFPWRANGHPRLPARKLLETPWHVVADGPRREIVSDPPQETATEVDTEQIEAKLRDLGYK